MEKGKHARRPENKSKQSIDKRRKNSDKFKTFIGNKSEGQGFADKRKKKIQYEYKKMLHKMKTHGELGPKGSSSMGSSSMALYGRQGQGNNEKGKSTFSRAQELNEERKERKKQKKKEALVRKQAQDEALTAYQKRKKDTFKKICKRTSKGQPVMKNQIEYLLQKIEKQVNQT
ncbi:thyroid transcription factor 1-associated protein 26-like isoform X2 [Mya arenaria]|uniref:thyroid transcription factor 1-associated protein 26-like isoform X2 n=1 Tax=Mya arenaria TaxID=6604 RepID=UPI0022E83582|nr:thyroid transcription factor 1-associated protein 26-like isoform X2 [Mya arenaria]